MDSELVRVSTPSLSESLGSVPESRILNSSFWVPQVPAARMRWRAVKVRRLLRAHRPVRTVSISQVPSGRWLKPVTVVIGITWAPAFSASPR